MLAAGCSSCGFFRFLGGALSSEVQSFSIEEVQSEALEAPLDVAQKIKDILEKQVVRMRALTKKKQDGDVQYQIIIKSFTYTPTFSTKNDTDGQFQEVEKLTLVVQVSYLNKMDQEASFKQKSFSASQDLVITEQKEKKEAELIDLILREIVDNICSDSIDIW